MKLYYIIGSSQWGDQIAYSTYACDEDEAQKMFYTDYHPKEDYLIDDIFTLDEEELTWEDIENREWEEFLEDIEHFEWFDWDDAMTEFESDMGVVHFGFDWRLEE